jgi:hypothetical protein
MLCVGTITSASAASRNFAIEKSDQSEISNRANIFISALSKTPVGTNTPSQNSNFQIVAACQLAVQAPVIPGCTLTLLLIEILHAQEGELFISIVDPPLKEVLSKVLFRVIISPNAP